MAKDSSSRPSGRVTVTLWDLPTRVFHWSLVMLVLLSYITAETDRLTLHRASGYAIAGLLVFRLYWGFVGSTSARFGSFVKSPRETLSYVRSLGSRKPSDAKGHNPLGAWSILLLLAVLIALVLSGLFSIDVDGLESGPLSDLVSFDTGRIFSLVHHRMFFVLEMLVLLHLVAVVFYLTYKRENLIRPIITGLVEADETTSPVWIAPAWRAIVGLAISAACVWVLVGGF